MRGNSSELAHITFPKMQRSEPLDDYDSAPATTPVNQVERNIRANGNHVPSTLRNIAELLSTSSRQ
jgi:hypothetical protein